VLRSYLPGRVCCWGTLAVEADALVADEPIAALDLYY
jgi:ABC-type dipeptide/oligopeptide/nickel transport system ATPase subunit